MMLTTRKGFQEQLRETELNQEQRHQVDGLPVKNTTQQGISGDVQSRLVSDDVVARVSQATNN